MSQFTRRRVLGSAAAGVAASAVPLSLLGEMGAMAGPPAVRYEASTSNGQANLVKYANAVKIMAAKQLGDPCSWAFQANTHWVRSNTTKAALVATLPAAQQPLANAMWNTCQNHGGQTTEDMFLPWHRMYVYYLEKIVQWVLNDTTFALPYWNYNASATASLPAKFLQPNNSTNPLFYAYRNPGPAAGNPLTGLSLDSLKQATYSGFCSTLDFGLHGDVHVQTGNSSQGMGTVPWAANDPIFFMHHCNIDRLWASWNHNGGTNPTTSSWLNQTFTFAQAAGYPATCQQVTATVTNFKDTLALGYTYDRFEPKPGQVLKFPFPLVLERINPILLKGPGPVELGARVTNTLVRGVNLTATKAPLLRSHLTALTSDRRIYLLLDGLMADRAPGVVYDVYINPEGRAGTDKALKAGTINFFGAVMPNGGRMKEPPKISFDVTDVLRNVDRGAVLNDKISVTFVPQGRANAAAKPMVQQVSLVEA
ncbi:MAG: tyrosinase family protein [Rhizomicrobium sp.]